jgi:hypothetical protein
MVVVEGTQADHLSAFFLEADMFAYDINDIVCLLNLIYYCSVKYVCHR